MSHGWPHRTTLEEEEMKTEQHKPYAWALSTLIDNGRGCKAIMGIRYNMTEHEAVGSFVDDINEDYGKDGFKVTEILRVPITFPNTDDTKKN
jgi:hypothetical protein